ncbi:hypothetical protein [Lysinibacillus capsici]|uniref:hypothetical protein n=1 Tax=Lysinibacillus capsici TaxID=2115968 RepID=UPI00248184EA|nr:hypothetical protein [Lysinibacillus capsici]
MIKVAPYVAWGILLLVFVLLSGLIGTFIFSTGNLIVRIIPLIMLFPIWFIGFCIVIYPLFLWNENLKKIYDKIFEFPINAMVKFYQLQTNISMVGMFFVVCLMPVGLSVAIIPNSWAFKFGLVYVISIAVLLLYTYKTQWILKLIDFTFNVPKRNKWMFEKLYKKNNPRIIAYSIMIIIYIIYNFDSFSNNYLGIDINLVKEVFVTFIAIDTLIQMFIGKATSK